MKIIQRYGPGFVVLMALIFLSLYAYAGPAATVNITQSALDKGEIAVDAVKGYNLPTGKFASHSGIFSNAEVYTLELKPGEAAFITAKKTISTGGEKWVIGLNYAVSGGKVQVAVIGMNAPGGDVDGQLGYTLFPPPTEENSGKDLTLYTIYQPPAKEMFGAVQVALPKDAKENSVVYLKSLEFYRLLSDEPVRLRTRPDGTFETASEDLLTNINGDKGDVIQEASVGRVVLSIPGKGEAANAGIQTINNPDPQGEKLLLANVDVTHLSGKDDGTTAVVLTDGEWNSGLFISNSLYPDDLTTQLIAGGLYRASDKPIWVFVQNGGGSVPSKLGVNNIVVGTLSLESVDGLNGQSVGYLAAALVLPKELYSGSQGSFSLTTINPGTHTPVSIPYEVQLTRSGETLSLGQGVTDDHGFASKTFTVPSGTPGAWKIAVRSENSTILSGDASLVQGGVLFIETDKPIYKPGQLIQGRVLYVNNALAPLQGEIELSISDAKGIKIHKEILSTNAYGVASFSLPLATELNFGTWKIAAKIGTDVQTEKDVEVDQYVLPTFENTINLPKDWFLVDEKIIGSIESKYFFGKPVQGKVHIEALRYIGTWDSYATADGRLNNGVFMFELPPVVYVDGTAAEEGAGTLQLKVAVTDDSGHEEKTDQLCRIVTAGVIIKLIPESSVIKPGLNQQVLIVTETPGGAPLSLDVDTEVVFYGDQGEISSMKNPVKTVNGMAIYQMEVPEKTLSSTLTVRATVDGKSAEKVEILNAAYSPGAHFIHLRQQDAGTLKVGAQAIFNVFATNEGTVFFDVYANGRTVFSNATEKRQIQFTVTPEMSPQAKVVAYMIQPDNEISADALPFQVELSAPTSLEAKFNAEEVKPGDAVQLSLQAQGDSMLGVAIVDQSVFALAKGRLNLQNVFAELERIFMEPQIETHDNSNSDIFSRSQPYFGGKGAQDVFADNNLQIITSKDLLVPKAEALNFWRWDFRKGGNLPPILMPVPTAEDNATGGYQSAAYQEPSRVRTFFPETWVWEPLLKTDAEGKVVLNLTAPDSITTWKLHAVSTSQQGMGITEGEIRVFQDFFVQPDLPYSVIRGDRFPMRVSIYNYVDTAQNIRITLQESEGLGLQDAAVQEVTVPAGGIAGVTFTLQPTKVGTLPVSLIAQSAQRADAIRKDLLVIPEGVRHEIIHNGILKDATEAIVDIQVPQPIFDTKESTSDILPPVIQIVPDSESVRVSITPSLLGQSMNGLEDLLGMPYGCGEQNMILLAPNIEVLRYLKSTGQLAPEIRAKAEYFITTGYQRELTYRHSDGSFSAFGEQDESGSLWLTAFVLDTFSNAREIRTIDSDVLSAAANWILSHQKADGSWQPVGFLIHQDLSGGLNGNLALSAYVAMSLLEYGGADATAIVKALNYLQANYTSKEADSYALALIAYVFSKADHPDTSKVIDLLLTKGIGDAQGLHWEPNAIETTAYAAIALMDAQRIEAQPAFQWLSLQRNGLGGYGSTQDTVVALKALTAAAQTQTRDLDATIEVVVDGKTVHTFQANATNFDVLQMLELGTVKQVVLRQTGKGNVLFQVVHAYNVPAVQEPANDNLFLEVKYSSDHVAVDDIVDVNVKVNYTAVDSRPGETDKTGMSIVDVSVPTGFALVQESLDKVKKSELIKRIEQAGRKVIFYIDYLTEGKPLEFTFQVKALYPVKADAGTSAAYLYYDPKTRTEVGGNPLLVE